MPLGVVPETAKEALKMWDEGTPVYTVEVGGLGPSYEQAIHIAVFELIRVCLKNRLPQDNTEASHRLDQYLARTHKIKNLDLTGSQASVAKHLAYMFVRQGYKFTIDAHKNLDRIQVCSRFPKS